MILAFLQDHAADHGAPHAAHEPPWSVFRPVWQWFTHTFPDASHTMGFDNPDRNLGQFWFEAISFSLVACVGLVVLSWAATRKYERVPRGLQNLLEWAVQAIRNMVAGVIPHGGDKYVPFLGTLFLFIFSMNMLGVIPAFRSPTMTISTTAAMGLTAIVLVQWYTIRDAGLKNVVKHLMGPVALLSPLMLPVELISELVRPVSLSLRLYGNIFGEDNIIEQLMGLGGGIPVQLPMLALALFTSFLQAYIFTMLCTIYIAGKVVHDEEHGHEEGHAPAPGAAAH
ncbi:MAG TPA: F0F1 ATP synthase subunit A [Planctomycetota bacterium]|nr:F0F1 ATP synthase subunit A [Planctomycetota bacterium]